MDHECSRQTDGQVKRQDYYGSTALCTKVHHTVKMPDESHHERIIEIQDGSSFECEKNSDYM